MALKCIPGHIASLAWSRTIVHVLEEATVSRVNNAPSFSWASEWVLWRRVESAKNWANLKLYHGCFTVGFLIKDPISLAIFRPSTLQQGVGLKTAKPAFHTSFGADGRGLITFSVTKVCNTNKWWSMASGLTASKTNAHRQRAPNPITAQPPWIIAHQGTVKDSFQWVHRDHVWHLSK